ncbi:MAG: acyltransferase [Christensenellaceae bacterium]|nr:acyltransferase [Christensenellaceae bacterium]
MLRLIAMLMIVFSHYWTYAVPSKQKPKLGVGFELLGSWGKWGCAVFVLITGYFLCTSKFQLKKLFKLLFQISFFSFVIAFIFYFAHNNTNPPNSLVKVFMHLAPNTFRAYISSNWFMIPYVFLFLMFPLLNIIIRNTGPRLHLIILAIGIFYISILPKILSECFKTSAYAPYIHSDLMTFVLLYFIAAYLRLYPNKILKNNLIILPISLVVTMVIIVTICCSSYRDTALHGPFVILSATLWLVVFANLKFSFKPINIISAGTLTVYLIHEARNFRTLFWKEWFVTNGSIWQNLYSVAIVFSSCLVIGIIYNYTINWMLAKYLDRPIDKLQVKICQYLKCENRIDK